MHNIDTLQNNPNITLHTQIDLGECIATVYVGNVGLWYLTWNDGIANGWVETFQTLATALLRAATLSAAIDREQTFKYGEREFALESRLFFDAQLG